MATVKTPAPVPTCCVAPMETCGYYPWMTVAACRHADCRQGYYAPCERHSAMGPTEARADYERLWAERQAS